MNLPVANTTLLRPFTETLKLLLQRPPRRQVAALCYRKGKKGTEVLLITSRTSKRWIIPKGWPMANHSARKTARIEAYEEAGVVGKASKEPIGDFLSFKGLRNGLKVRTIVSVYAIKVDKQIKNFPEKGERDFAWLSPDKALEQCNDPGLRDLLQREEVKRLLRENKGA